MGYTLSFISSIFFTLYIVLKKFTKQKNKNYNLFVGLGYFLCSLTVFLCLKSFKIINEPWFDFRLLWACLGGFMWAIALVMLMSAIDRIGVARAGQYKNLQAPFGALLILFVLSEFKDMNVFIIILAIVLTFLGAICFSIQEQNVRIELKGVFMAVASAVCYSMNSVIRKMVTEFGFVYSQQLYSSLAIVISIAILLFFINGVDKNKGDKRGFWLKIKKECVGENVECGKDNYIGLGAGLSYFLASIFITLSYTDISGTVAFIISQLCTVWTALSGVFIFREISFKKHWSRILIGLVFSITGIILLSLS